MNRLIVLLPALLVAACVPPPRPQPVAPDAVPIHVQGASVLRGTTSVCDITQSLRLDCEGLNVCRRPVDKDLCAQGRQGDVASVTVTCLGVPVTREAAMGAVLEVDCGAAVAAARAAARPRPSPGAEAPTEDAAPREEAEPAAAPVPAATSAGDPPAPGAEAPTEDAAPREEEADPVADAGDPPPLPDHGDAVFGWLFGETSAGDDAAAPSEDAAVDGGSETDAAVDDQPARTDSQPAETGKATEAPAFRQGTTEPPPLPDHGDAVYDWLFGDGGDTPTEAAPESAGAAASEGEMAADGAGPALTPNRPEVIILHGEDAVR